MWEWKVRVRSTCTLTVKEGSERRGLCSTIDRLAVVNAKVAPGTAKVPGQPTTTMAVPGATTMRLTVQVLPLAEEDAHGPYRSRALEVFKGRKFAMPVPWGATLEHVWSLIEQRYVDNYLEAQQAANFTMKKLQDAYDCDLDLRDTVASIFGGETDPTMRMIKVVPSFLGRSCSVPFTSHLRPASAQKRARGANEGGPSKRRRTDHQPHDDPVPSTEHCESGTRASRSLTAASLVLVHHVQTGDAEFAPAVKQESPELGLSAPAPEADAQMQHEAVDATVHARDPLVLAPKGAEAPEPESEPESLSHPASVEPPHSQPRTTSRRKDIWDVPSSSPDFLHKPTPKTTYARSPRTATTVRKEVGLLNSSRLKPIRSQQSQPSPQSLEKRKEPAQPKKRGRPPLNREQHATPSKPAKAKSSASPRASRSISATVSTRSSPAVTRRPARFLTHSPSPEDSASEGESEEKSVPPQQPKSLGMAVDEIPSDSDSDSTDTSTEVDDREMEMTVAVTKPEPDVVVPSTADDALPSSPPKLNGAPTSTAVVPATSQPAPSQTLRKTPIPLPSKTPIPLPSNSTQTPRSSQSISAQAAARRPVPRHSGFRTIREQLADAKSSPVTTKKNAYDPRCMVLSKMANKKLGAAAGLADDDDDSEDEESSSSSDSD
ncbi:hypothetical protein BDU57DRAFT_438942 [Ampelomyces quisqualis]|uniref:Nucleolar protein Dnt1-like N-terminal domain-containing protein n=1 Tax=Ampelomyces quisqualis TaxID=50730 RepID=A0A6A5R0B0_AMPQU|nr:hypothetical protein BDU57DRAFT_438942 [Ampelomyces quisqualis]